ncbi:MAG: Ion channel [Planctomycetaceae bacterium]|nr:Ion channel [Planctomycetaceae bacterium]
MTEIYMNEIWLFGYDFFTGLWVTWPVLCFLVFIKGALGIVVGRIEKWSTFDSIYFSLITGMTVGYGDFSPSHRISKICSVLITLVGLVFSGIIVAASVEAMRRAMLQMNVAVTM